MEQQKRLNSLIAANDNEAAKELVDKGYSLNDTFLSDMFISILTQNEANEATPLYTACLNENNEMTRYLLENGANPNVTRFRREYPLVLYLENSYASDESLLDLFIEKGVDLNRYEISPPMVALMKHYYRSDDESEAESTENREIIERELRVLIKNGLKWQNDDPYTQYDGYSILHFVAATDRTDFMRELLTYDNAMDYLNSQTSDGYTPLHFAAFNNEQAMYDFLIQAGADVTIRDDDGKTAEEYLSASDAWE